MSTAPIRRLTAQEVSRAIITAAMKVHSELGHGLLESAYQACLQHQLYEAGVRCASQVGLPVVYHGVKLEIGYRMDLLVEDLVIVEIKSVDSISPVPQAQVISYLKLERQIHRIADQLQRRTSEGWDQAIRERDREERNANRKPLTMQGREARAYDSSS